MREYNLRDIANKIQNGEIKRRDNRESIKALQMYDRILARIAIYQEHLGEQPFSAELVFHDSTKCQEQPRSSRITLSEAWRGINTIDIPPTSVGLVLIENRAGKDRTTIPTEEEIKSLESHVIYMGLETGDSIVEFAIVRPGRFALVEACNIEKIRLRSHHEEELAKIYLFIR